MAIQTLTEARRRTSQARRELQRLQARLDAGTRDAAELLEVRAALMRVGAELALLDTALDRLEMAS